MERSVIYAVTRDNSGRITAHNFINQEIWDSWPEHKMGWQLHATITATVVKQDATTQDKVTIKAIQKV
jgi:hypothetical protein